MSPRAPTLVILAAGMGNRYGGLKQLTPLGPGGETLMEYSVLDAARAGFGRLVFVIRREFEDAFRTQVLARFEHVLPVELVFQELGDVPPGFDVPAGRGERPWGTGHATLAARHVVHEPFGVINADDFYGRDSFEKLAGFLSQPGLSDAPVRSCLVTFTLRNTLSDHGAVARGVCRASSGGLLEGIVEMTAIHRVGDRAENRPPGAAAQPLTGDEPVSLNTWGFAPGIFPHLERLFAECLAATGRDRKAEFFLTSAIDQLIREGRESCRIVPTSSSWFGVTFKEDADHVRTSLAALHRRGEYPERLWAKA
jgi:UTP-glucose-1-phosphate uridylyltransferase